MTEHLKFVCELKNVPGNQIEELTSETLQVVMLTEHKHKMVSELSGGMKRKLSLAMAIVSKPKVIILDEPTSGLDVESRRQTWELIKRLKVGRSIIMSSQHLEEADELADRICIMTKGKLLALDRPEGIKKQFGVGYKLLIEPKVDQISQQEFQELTNTEIGPLVLSAPNRERGYGENSDSTRKKVIYQVPFSQVQSLSGLLSELEARFGDRTYIDIEMNSLEDAYINIAKEEEKLIANMASTRRSDRAKSISNIDERQALIQSHNAAAINETINETTDLEASRLYGTESNTAETSRFPVDLERFMNAKSEPAFHRQAWANCKRRLIQFIKSPQEIVLNVQILLFILIQIILLQTILSITFKLAEARGSDAALRQTMEEMEERILHMAFPALVLASIVTSGALFVVTAVQDREDKLRYLLKFSGMTSTAYFFGLVVADMILFCVPCGLVVLLSYFLDIKSFYANAGEILMALFMFGLGFMQLNYLVGYLFSTAESAFKYQLVAMGAYYALKLLAHLVDVLLLARGWTAEAHWLRIEMFFLYVSPFECLGELMSLALGRASARQALEPPRADQATVYQL